MSDLYEQTREKNLILVFMELSMQSPDNASPAMAPFPMKKRMHTNSNYLCDILHGTITRNTCTVSSHIYYCNFFYLMDSFYCSQPVKSSGELKSRGVKLLPGKDNTNKFSLSKSFICLMQMFSLFELSFFHSGLVFWVFGFFLVSLSLYFLLHHLVKALSYSTRFCRSAVFYLSDNLFPSIVSGLHGPDRNVLW